MVGSRPNTASRNKRFRKDEIECSNVIDLTEGILENEEDHIAPEVPAMQRLSSFASSSSSSSLLRESNSSVILPPNAEDSRSQTIAALMSRDIQFSRSHCLAKFLHAKLGTSVLLN